MSETRGDGLPEKIGPYRIEARLGEGGMGEVYRAFDERLERRVAIKLLKRLQADSSKARERLRREAKAIARLNHPAIVQVYDILEDERGDWVVMELVEGENLRQLLDRSPLEWRQAVKVGRDLCAGLSAAHIQGIVHRDLKSENVMLTPEGRIKILDFGLAKRIVFTGSDESTISDEGEILGTVRSMSPEQAKGEALDHRSDLFSLGSLLYETLTGHSPFEGTSMVHTLARICTDRQAPLHEVRPDVPPELSEVVDQLLEKDPAERPESAFEVALALERIAGEGMDLSAVSRSAFSGLSSPSFTGLRRGEASGSASVPGITIRTLVYVGVCEREKLAARVGGAGIFRALARHDQLVREVLRSYGGLEVEKSDTFLLLFERPSDAVRFAVAYHRRLVEDAADLGGLKTRVGIHVGEVYLRENPPEDVRRGARPLEADGLTRRVAASVVKLARGDQILATQAVYDLSQRVLRGTDEEGKLAWSSYGEYFFSGLDESVRLFEVGLEGSSIFLAPADSALAWKVGRKKRSSRRLLLAAAILAATLLAALAGLEIARWGPGEPRRSIAVLGFQNLTGRQDIDWVSMAISEILSTELAAGEQLRLVSGEEVARMRRELDMETVESLAPDTLRKVGRNLNTQYVVVGSYARAGSTLRVQLSLQDTQGGETLAAFQETGREQELFDVVSRLGTELRRRIGVEKKTLAEARAVRATVSDDREATRLYALGLEKLRSLDALEAKELLLRAVELDDSYALAHAALAEAWLELGYDAKAAESARKALDLSEGLPREQALRIEGLYQEAAGEWLQAIETYRALSSFFPDKIEHGLRLAKVQTIVGGSDQALKTVEEMRRRNPAAAQDARVDLAEVEAAYWISDYDRQIAAARAAARKAEQQGARLLFAQARWQLGWGLYHQNRFDESLEALEEAKAIYEQAGVRGRLGQVLDAMGSVVTYQGRLDVAEDLYRQALALLTEVGDRKRSAGVANHLAYLIHMLGQLEEARSTVEAALASVREVGDRNREASMLDTLTWISVQLDPAEAGELATRERELYQKVGDLQMIPYTYCYEALSAVAEGRLALARDLYAEAGRLAAELDNEYVWSFYHLSRGELQLAEDDLDGAGRSFAVALEKSRSLGEEEGVAHAELWQVRLVLARGERTEARRLAQEAEERFRKEGRMDLVRGALVVQARAHLEDGKVEPAARALERFGETENPSLRFEAEILRARLKAARGEVAGARKDLQGIRDDAKERGLVGVALAARLALGEVEEEAGMPLGREELGELATEARELGFARIARQAEDARS